MLFRIASNANSKIRKVFANQGNEIGSITKATLGHPEFVFALQGSPLKAITLETELLQNLRGFP